MRYLVGIIMFELVAATLFISAPAAAMPPAKAFGAMVRVEDVVPGCPKKMCSLEVVPSPLPGRTRVVNRRDVVAAIERAGFTPSGLKIPTRRRVIRPAKRISEEVLRNRILDSVRTVLPQGVALEELGHLQDIEVPRAGFDARARWPGNERFRRRVSIPVDLMSDGVKFLTIQVSALLVMEIDVPVAKRALQAGTIIAPSDIVWETVRLDAGPDSVVVSPGEIVGRKVDRYMAPGTPFEHRSLERIPVVHKGGQLTVESVFGLVRVKTTGIVRQDGAVGDRVRVILLPANRMVWAEIVGPGRAVVMP